MASRVSDVFEVLHLLVVEFAEQSIEQDLGETDHRVERRPQLVGHAGQELGLVTTRDLQFVGLERQLLEEASVVDRERRLARERLEQIRDLRGKFARDAPSDDKRPENSILANEWNREHRAPAGTSKFVQVGVRRRSADVWDPERRAARTPPARRACRGGQL